MPQASDRLREEMKRRFGDINYSGPVQFLETLGWKLNRDWTWSKPGLTKANAPKQMTKGEFLCLLFLACAWDYGGINFTQSEH